MLEGSPFPEVTQYAIPLFVIGIIIELYAIRKARLSGDYETRDTLTSLLMGTGNVVTGIITAFIGLWVYLWAWEYRLFDWGTSALAVIACFFLDDFKYYWHHRIAHRSRWVWADHVNHHSSQHYNLSTALRQGWTVALTGMFILGVPLVLLGFHPYMVLFVGGLNLTYQFWIHTETIGKMPRWFEAVFNTPSHHRVHHASNARYLDANYAGTLIIWDRLFGTFVPETEAEKPRYGLVNDIATFNPFRVAFHEWVALAKDAVRPGLTLRQRMGYLFGPPGWSHDGSRKTSEMLKADYVARHPQEAGKPGLPDRAPKPGILPGE
ncbi:MAG: sterol desaturase family protein [Rhizobiaceae bacterium]|jgi:sterol desaturase/sphingolipid hydroxylase (fatty acid hydroxylase superfamily)|nr:sterol desaturase family protein [Rhizobiaceae bacterium]